MKVRFLTPLSLVVILTSCGSPTMVKLDIREPPPPTLNLALSSNALTVFPDNTSTQTLQVTATATGLTTPAIVTVSGLVSGLNVSPSQLELQNGASGTFIFQAGTEAGAAAITAAGGTAFGANPSVTLPITIQASSGSTEASAALSLTISGTNLDFLPATTDLPVIQITTHRWCLNRFHRHLRHRDRLHRAGECQYIGCRLFGHNGDQRPRKQHLGNAQKALQDQTRLQVLCPRNARAEELDFTRQLR